MSGVDLERVRFIDHKGRRILFMDLSDIKDPGDGFPLAEKNHRMASAQPAGSVLTLTYVANARFNTAIIKALAELVKNNRPYVKAGSIVGLSGLQRAVYTAIGQLTGRKLPTFETLDEAKEWLVTQ